MTKEEFLKKETRDVTEIFEKYDNYTPTFSVLDTEGNVNSFATGFSGLQEKDAFDYFMKKICEDPKVIASIFTCVGWTSEIAIIEYKRPSECSDREKNIILIYNTRDNDHRVYLYKPDKNGKLQLTLSDDSFGGDSAIHLIRQD